MQEAEEFGLEYIYVASSTYTNKPLYNFKCQETGLTIPLSDLNRHNCQAKLYFQDGYVECGDVFSRMRMAIDKVEYTKTAIRDPKAGLSSEPDPQDVKHYLVALEEMENMATVARNACQIARRRYNQNFLKIINSDGCHKIAMPGYVPDSETEQEPQDEI